MQEIAILFSASGDVRQKLFAEGVSFFEKNTTHLLTYLLLRACLLKSSQDLILRSVIQTSFFSLIQTKVQGWSLIKKGPWLFFTFRQNYQESQQKLSVVLERCWKTINNNTQTHVLFKIICRLKYSNFQKWNYFRNAK